MKRICYLFIYCLLFCLLFSLCACEHGSGQTADISDEPNPAGSSAPVENPVQYTIIYPDIDANKTGSEAAVALRKALNAILGDGAVAIRTDWVDRGKTMEETRSDHEILIARTNRPESDACTELLKENTSEQLDYLIRQAGDHYVLCASDGYLSDAVNAFISFIKEDTSYITGAPKELSLSRAHVFGADSIVIAGIPVENYTAIVYPDNYHADEKAQLTAFQSLIFEACGTYLPMTPVSEGVSDPAIRIGAVRDESLFSAGPYSFSVSSGTAGVDICGRDFFGEWRGLMYLQDQITGHSGNISVEADYRRLTETGSIGRIAWFMGAPGSMENDQQFIDCKDCGFNVIILNCSDDRVFELGLRMAKYELQGLWLSADLNWYFDSDICWGCYLKDEPNADMFAELGQKSDLFRKYHPDARLYVNMLPSQALPETMHCPDYDTFLERFFDEVRPTYASVDEYSLRKFGDSPSDLKIAGWYYYDLDVYAKACRARGIPYGAYLQSVTFSANTRQISENDLRFQAFSCLAFGYRDIQYYTYVTSNYSDDGYIGALIDRDFEKRPIWYGAQKLNREMEAFGYEYCTYDCLGTFCAGKKREKFTQFEGQYTVFAAISSVETDGCVVIGCFERNEEEYDGKYAFFCANTADPDIRADDVHVTVTLSEGSGVTLWQNGVPTEIDAINGQVSFVLPTADGVFAQIR
ncbi:MAG: hypothetical protein MJ175_10950 [Clostridia bacterium]|nr:hypothetical protein [Clostridia bacterium]